MRTRSHGSRRTFIAVLGGVGLVAPFGLGAYAETEAERKARTDRETKMAAWLLGATLSKAVLMVVASDPAETKKNFSFADRAAATLGVELKPLPAKFDPPQEFSKYLTSDDMKALTQTLAKKYSREHAELFEVAIKTAVFGLFYFPDDRSKQNSTVFNTLKPRYEALHLPASLWMPFLVAIRDGKPAKEVNRLSNELLVAVMNYLNPPKPK